VGTHIRSSTRRDHGGRKKEIRRKDPDQITKDNLVRGAKNPQPKTEEAAFENGRSVK
jgi:hypothetical protein